MSAEVWDNLYSRFALMWFLHSFLLSVVLTSSRAMLLIVKINTKKML